MHDESLDLIHNRARTLHPRLGMFIQRDPLEYINSINLYQYVGRNPIRSIDPSGLYDIEWEGNWTTAQKEEINDSFSRVKARAQQLIQQLDGAYRSSSLLPGLK